MKKKIVIGNWKTNKTQREVKDFFKQLNNDIRKNSFPKCRFGVAPVSVHLQLAQSLAPRGMIIASQDANAVSFGAFTGTVSWAQLKDIKIKYVVVGHSERRMYYNETDACVNTKVKALLENKMVPILCIGENLDQFNAQITKQVCQQQLQNALQNISHDLLSNLIVAYEPIWAIGTGKTAAVANAQATIQSIRGIIGQIANDQIAKQVAILYGGSVRPDNIQAIISQPDINGVLVGGASLSERDYWRLLKCCC